MLLLLDRAAHLRQCLGNLGTGITQDTLELAREGFLVGFAGVEGDRLAREAGSAGSTDSMDVVL